MTNIFNRQYKEKIALEKVSFDIGENELVGFIGPNGAGKTTTMKMLAGILYPTSGEISVLGYTPFEKNYTFLKQIAFVMGQKNQLLWELPAIDSFDLYKEIYELENDTYHKNLNELVDLLDANTLLQQPIKTLSLGQRMRMELIASLLHKPKILFLDEPTIGLDIFAQTTIRNFIQSYQERYKATIMLTSHYMQDVQQLAKRILLIDNGKLLFDGKLQDLVDKYSNKKIVTITLNKPLKDESIVKKYRGEYTFPQLKLFVKKVDLEQELPYIMKNTSFEDVSVEDESLEDIIKKELT